MTSYATLLFAVLATLCLFGKIRRLSVARRPHLPHYERAIDAQRALSAALRLFDRREREFLRAQPGYRRSLERRLEFDRVHILGLYLTQLRLEHREAVATARQAAAALDRPDLAIAAAKKSIEFYPLYLVIQLQLLAGVPLRSWTPAGRLARPLFGPRPAAAAAGASVTRTA